MRMFLIYCSPVHPEITLLHMLTALFEIYQWMP